MKKDITIILASLFLLITLDSFASHKINERKILKNIKPKIEYLSSACEATSNIEIKDVYICQDDAKMKNIKYFIHKYSAIYDVDPKLVKGVIAIESEFNPKARSRCGAMGLMQLMPSTARSLGVNRPYDVEQNIKGGTKYLGMLLEEHNNNVEFALAAYNAGSGQVIRHKGIPPIKETILYVNKVMEKFRQG